MLAIKPVITPFLEFVLSAAVNSLNEIKKTIIYFIRKFSLRDYYLFLKQDKRITARQHGLLSLLLDKPVQITLKKLFEATPFSILYNNVSTQTARRDLKKLTELYLLTIDKDGKYVLNLRALG